MKEGHASRTAMLVALLRALADLGLTSVPGFRDPTARHLLAPPWSSFFRFIEGRVLKGARPPRDLAAIAFEPIALRTLIIDAYLREALVRGVRQVVILGAGLDGRAYRIQELAEAEVFEVDHPATQAFKRARLGSLTSTAKQLRFVTVDFEKESLDVVLEQAGHRTREPTFFIWEGVVMYLTDAAVRGTLRVVAERSAPGSGLVINYATPGMSRQKLHWILRFWGEPMIGERTPEAMKGLLEEAGFEVVEDTGITEWAQRFGADKPHPRTERRFRMVLARVRDSRVGS
jgi:methyltransferase (TIGR00027 family)